MRFIYEASHEDIKQLKLINEFSRQKLTPHQIFEQAIDFYFNVHQLLDTGHKLCLEDAKGNKKYFGKDFKSKNDPKDFWGDYSTD